MSTVEEDYTKQKVMPALAMLGFHRVEYYHGTGEYGKDVIFADYDRLGFERFYAAQVKVEKLSARASRKFEDLISQIKQAFSMPFTSPKIGDTHYIAELFIIARDGISEPFKRSIREREELSKRRIVFLSGAELEALSLQTTVPSAQELSENLKGALQEMFRNQMAVNRIRHAAENNGYLSFHPLISSRLDKAISTRIPNIKPIAHSAEPAETLAGWLEQLREDYEYLRRLIDRAEGAKDERLLQKAISLCDAIDGLHARIENLVVGILNQFTLDHPIEVVDIDASHLRSSAKLFGPSSAKRNLGGKKA